MSRAIALNEDNPNLRCIYFDVRLIDGITPALDEAGGQPEININSLGWQNDDIGILEDLGFGKYKAALTSTTVSVVDSIIVSRYKSDNTAEIPGEELVVVPAETLILTFSSDPVVSANCYVSYYEGENYFATRLNSTVWECAIPTDKAKSLIMATRSIDRLFFSGSKTDPLQYLEFPRKGATNVPDDIKIACCEIAYAYLDGIEMELELQNLNVTQQSFSSVRETCDRTIIEEAIRAGIPSAVAWTYLKPYLNDPFRLRLSRVS